MALLGSGLAGAGFLSDFAMAVLKCDNIDCRSGVLSFFSLVDGAIVTSCCRAVCGNTKGSTARKEKGISSSGG